VVLTLLFGDAAAMLQQLDARVDAFFLDGFAPSKNPEMWSAPVFAELARLARPGATAATYSVAGSVREGLARAGFAVEKHAGFARKREMLFARYPGQAAETPSHRDRRALVIGAGLAGTACAQRLAERGWQVDLLERHSAPAQEASGNPAGLLRPIFSPDWNTHSRFTVASFLYALRHHAALARGGFPVTAGAGGVLQIARDERQFEKQQRMHAEFGLSAEIAQLMHEARAGELAGTATSGPGLWFPQAAWVAPASICRANLLAAGYGIRAHFGAQVAALGAENGNWVASDAMGKRLAAAPVAVLANAQLATAFAPTAQLPLRAVRGQVSLFRASASGRVPLIAVCREGYVTPPIDGMHCLGASFNEGLFEADLRAEDHAANLHRLARMLPDFSAGLDAAEFAGRVAFRAMSPDRLPLLGAVSHQPGLYTCLGLGSRGMTWSALAAEVVASRMNAEPMPLERDILAGLDAERFADTGATTG
jgi:tRNA 5-methylaminomethyl-2-thiouridine biosynthesis bifunctional protein